MAENAKNISITDFTMHKVRPVKKETVPVQKEISKPQKAVKAVKPAKPLKPVKPVKPVKPEKPKNPEKPAIPETLVVKPEKKTEFSRKKYAENLNTYLEKTETTGVAQPKSVLKSDDYFDYMVKPALSLGVVLALILIIAWLYTKFKNINPATLFSGKFNNINKFNVLASSSLGQGKIIHLVEINGKQLVVGSTNNNINLLTEISPEDMDKLQKKASEKSQLPPEEEEQDDNSGLDYEEPSSYSAKYTDLYREYIRRDRADS